MCKGSGAEKTPFRDFAPVVPYDSSTIFRKAVNIPLDFTTKQLLFPKSSMPLISIPAWIFSFSKDTFLRDFLLLFLLGDFFFTDDRFLPFFVAIVTCTTGSNIFALPSNDVYSRNRVIIISASRKTVMVKVFGITNAGLWSGFVHCLRYGSNFLDKYFL